jgi:catechol 2,3-dioxygenase-like lactoylglutathione lyase family enzyme
MMRPPATTGLRHVALNVKDLDACERFYTELLGMHVAWRPNANNVYLTSGNDNLALHRTASAIIPESAQRLDHIGFVVPEAADVDSWFEFLKSKGVAIVKVPKTHRDGARSFYCQDPAGNTVQMIYLAPQAKNNL